MEMDPKSATSRSDTEEAIFSEAVELPAEEREAFVRKRCKGDEPLAQSILALLTQFDRLGSFLSSPPLTAVPLDIQITPQTLLAGRFRVRKQLGRGGMGIVYLAEDLELGETVALKMIREVWLDDASMLTRFRNEIRLARKISHPNVCHLYDLFTDSIGGRPRVFFTMEYLEGRSLAEMLLTAWRPDQDEILHLLSGIAAGLSAAHDCGIVHRDLKPGNILLISNPDGSLRPVIMDFGLAQALAGPGGSVTQPGQIVGSPDYMAPEQFVGEPATPATDVFSLAVIAYELATGSRPWPEENLIRTAMRRVGGSKAQVDCGPRFPRRWNPILENALARDPRLRPARATHFVAQLQRAKRGFDPRTLIFFPTRRAAISGSVAATLSLIYGLYRYKEQKQRPVTVRGDPVLVITPIEHFAGYDDYKALDFLMQTQLRESAHIQVLEKEALQRAWNKMHPGNVPPLADRLQP